MSYVILKKPREGQKIYTNTVAWKETVDRANIEWMNEMERTLKEVVGLGP